jgi:hypothetical protein
MSEQLILQLEIGLLNTCELKNLSNTTNAFHYIGTAQILLLLFWRLLYVAWIKKERINKLPVHDNAARASR